MRISLLATLCTLVSFGACDPGSSLPSEGAGGATQQEPNELMLLPKEPPGEVSMVPPVAGELDPFDQNRALGRGMNIGNCLDAPTEGAWGVTLHQYQFEVIKRAGFDSVRLPVKWSAHAATTAPYTIDADFFDRVDWAIAHALTRGLKLVLDIHHYGNTGEDGIYNKPAEHHERFLALWQQIADHYKDYPKELYFEVLNEPRGQLEPLWNQYLAEAVATIRESNPGRTLIVGGVEYNKWYRLKDVVFPNDSNVIATFHYYNPYCFTLQDGQNWEAVCKIPGSSSRPTSGMASWPVIYPEKDPDGEATEATQRAKLDEDMTAAAAWATAANLPLYMGEFGVAQAANSTARVDYTQSLARAAEKNGITWAYWELASTFGIWSHMRLEWNEAMLEALIPPGSTVDWGSRRATDNAGAGGAATPSSSGGAGSTNVQGTAGASPTGASGGGNGGSGGGTGSSAANDGGAPAIVAGA